MRQFVLGLIVAALAWWGYGKWTATDAVHAAPPVGNSGVGNSGLGNSGLGNSGLGNSGLGNGGAGNGSAGTGNRQPAGPGGLNGLLQNGGGPSPGTMAKPTGGSDSPLEAAPTSSNLAEDLAKLLPRIEAGDPAAIGTGWAAVASGQLGREHDRVVASLAPKSEEFAKQLAALGSHNAFLHSKAGRAAAEKVLAATTTMPDAASVKAGSQLVYLMTRGRIERSDMAARSAVDKAYRQHRIRVDRWLCNPTNVAGARSYTVQPGNSLDVIARKFRKQGIKIEAGTIAVLNRITNPNLLRAGQKLKIPVAAVSAVLEKRSYALMVFVGDELLRLYWVGHGEHDRTPVTDFTVIAKQEKPDWTSPDGNVYAYGRPENILGEYFIKFGHDQYSGFGAHGTPMKDTICTMSSMGCIRMFDADISELFRILPRGAKVIVQSTESIR